MLLESTTGELLALAQHPHTLVERADGTREQDPRMWIDAARRAIAGLRLADRGALEIAGIGVSGQQHGLVCLDAEDRPVRAAKLWNDTTTQPECDALTERLGGREGVLALIGNAFLPGYTAPKAEWLRTHEPEAYARTRRMCLPHDLIDLWLTGEFATEPGDASGTAYFDPRERAYSEPVLRAIDDARDWAATLPRVVPSLSVLGRLRAPVAAELGLPPGTPVSAGGGDNMCSAIGVGAVREGPVVVSLGTSGTAFAYRASAAVDPAGEAAAFCDSTGGWLPLVCTLNCAATVAWACAMFGRDIASLDAALAASPPGARGVTFLPYLGGERTPSCPAGTGAWSGLRSEHGADDLIRAVVEGVTFGLAYALDALRRTGVAPTAVTLVGGGAASDAWAQLVADALGVPAQRTAVTEAAAVGAAVQARWAVDGVRAAEPAPLRTFEPRRDDALAAAAARADRVRTLALEGAL